MRSNISLNFLFYCLKQQKKMLGYVLRDIIHTVKNDGHGNDAYKFSMKMFQVDVYNK